MHSSRLKEVIFHSVLLTLCLSLPGHADTAPFSRPGYDRPDGAVGAFSQNNTGDCFFLASLLAIIQDSTGRTLIESIVQSPEFSNQWRIIFPNLPLTPVIVTEQDLDNYQLAAVNGQGTSAPVRGDADIKLLEIAADKIWKKTIKTEGLWDDVPMNALFMFTPAQQYLIWNKSKATETAHRDIEKYLRIPAGIVNEIEVSSEETSAEQLKKILFSDPDGISMVLIDYDKYHAVAIKNIDFKQKKYSYIDTASDSVLTKNLDSLLQGIAQGQYAITYVEIP